MNNVYKSIYKQIKKYNNIVIARHIGADPDALCSQLSLKELILNIYPNKKVYAIGTYASKFKYLGSLDKLEDIEDTHKCLLIVLDTPDLKRIDGANPKDYEYVIKIDHHPYIDDYANLEIVDDKSSSVCQLLLEFIFKNKLAIPKSVAEKLYTGIIADTDRFLHPYTSVRTFELVTKLLQETNIEFTNLYNPLYKRQVEEIKFLGYIYNNFEITKHGVAYIKIDDKILKEYNVDTATSGSLVNNLKHINSVYVIVFLTEDKKNNLIKANIRSEGPIINELATKYGGGGHIYASGAKIKTWEETDNLIQDLDKLVKNYTDTL